MLPEDENIQEKNPGGAALSRALPSMQRDLVPVTRERIHYHALYCTEAGLKMCCRRIVKLPRLRWEARVSAAVGDERRAEASLALSTSSVSSCADGRVIS